MAHFKYIARPRLDSWQQAHFFSDRVEIHTNSIGKDTWNGEQLNMVMAVLKVYCSRIFYQVQHFLKGFEALILEVTKPILLSES